jgi:DNA-binding NarL/FixJ family response regulator
MWRVLIAESDAKRRERLANLLEPHADLLVLEVVRTFHDAVRAVARRCIDLTVLGLPMPGCDGIELIADLKAIRPSMRILVHSELSQRLLAVRALEAGADGFVDDVAASTDLAGAIRRVATGARYLDPQTGFVVARSVLRLASTRRAGATRRVPDAATPSGYS